MDNLLQWTRQDNDQYEDLQSMYKSVTDQYMRYINHVMKNLGGQYRNNMPGMEPVEKIPAWRQKEAVRFMGEQVFEAPVWLYPSAVVTKTGTDIVTDNNVRQDAMLGRMMALQMLSSVYNASLTATTGDAVYRLDDYLKDLFATVWKPLGDDVVFSVTARRQLQRSYVQNLNKLLNPTEAEQKSAFQQRISNTDALLYVAMHLSTVEDYCKSQLAQSDTKRSPLNTAHYEDLLRELKLIRERRTTVSSR
jgi:hypothetical protein